MKNTAKTEILKLHALGWKPAKIARKVKCTYGHAYQVIKASERLTIKSNEAIIKELLDVAQGYSKEKVVESAESAQEKTKYKWFSNKLLADLYGKIDYESFVTVGAALQREERA